MGIEALTVTDNGVTIVPRTKEDWTDWVRATATRNYILEDPLLDWLDLYGHQNGFAPDYELPGYDSRTDFSRFVMNKGISFEQAVVKHLATLVPILNVATNPMDSRQLEAAQRTFEAMCRGEHVISQAVLRDAENRTYGLADLLIRSDQLLKLFPGHITEEEASVPAPDLGNGSWHYRVIDIKFTTLHFSAGGGLGNSGGSGWTNKAQVHIYNRALGRLQGYLPPEAFLIGRGWDQTIRTQKSRGFSCLDRLGAVPQDSGSRSKGSVESIADDAIAWARRVRLEGADWQVLPQPSIPELRPNMGSKLDSPWHYAKQQIGSELEDLTLVWQVGLKAREKAHASNITRWSDAACQSQELGITGSKRAPTLDLMLEVNRSKDGPPVLPEKIVSSSPEWRESGSLEFFVDFETVNDLNDDFERIPEKNGQPLIFMVGCGHMEEGEWQWSVFTTDYLTEACEAEILDAWFVHMDEVKQRIGHSESEPIVFHWSHAEASTLETAFNSAKERHPSKTWPDPRWYDFLQLVMREEPIVVRGSLGFGLKSIANAMQHHGLIESRWDSGPTDGLGAMVGAWWSACEAKRLECTLTEIEMIREIQLYNEIDCKAMMEIITYLRQNH